MPRGRSKRSRPIPVLRSRGGLTLIEILVCLMLLSLLAAAVFPVVTQRVARGEPLRTRADLTAYRDAIERFARDMDGLYPSHLEDLATRPDSASRAIGPDGTRTGYGTAALTRWTGPYLSQGEDGVLDLSTGFGVRIQPELVVFDAASSAPAGSPDFLRQGGSLFLAVPLGNGGGQLSVAQFEAINDAIDGPGERDGPGPGTSWTSGRLRFDDGVSPGDRVAYYLVVPLER